MPLEVTVSLFPYVAVYYQCMTAFLELSEKPANGTVVQCGGEDNISIEEYPH